MAISTAQYTLTTTATSILSDTVAAEEVHLHVNGGVVYVGDAGVTSSNGLRLDNGDKISFNTHLGPMYAVAASGTVTLYVAVIEK
jgi:hypothetical protein